MAALLSLSALLGSLSMNSASVRKLHGLTQRDAAAVAQALQDCGGSWSVEPHQAEDGDLLILVAPEDDGAPDITFVLYRDAGRIHLRRLRGDDYEALGSFETLDEAMGRLGQETDGGCRRRT
jgi:hypothetical protein